MASGKEIYVPHLSLVKGKIVKNITYQKSIREIRLNLDGTDPGAYIVKLRSDNQFATAIFVVN